MPGKRIPALTAIAGASTANDDNLVIYDTSEGTTKRILRSQLAAGIVGDLPYTPAGFIAATTVSTAIAEIASDLAAAGGASLVGYLPAGTGAVATTVQAKLRESVSVKDFGAVGDGSDESAKIQAALATGAGTIYFPDPITFYKFGDVNITTRGQQIVGSGMQKCGVVPMGTNCFNVKENSVEITGFWFRPAVLVDDTQDTSNTTNLVYVLSPAGETQALDGFRFHDNYCQDIASAAIYTKSNLRESYIYRNQFRGMGSVASSLGVIHAKPAATFTDSSNYVYITENVFFRAGKPFIYLKAVDLSNPAERYYDHWFIENNLFHGGSLSGLGIIGGDTHMILAKSVDGLMIDNNTFTSFSGEYSAIYVDYLGSDDKNGLVAVRDNRLYVDDNGVYTGTAVVLRDCFDNFVTGNVIKAGFQSVDVSVTNSGTFTYTPRLDVSGNLSHNQFNIAYTLPASYVSSDYRMGSAVATSVTATTATLTTATATTLTSTNAIFTSGGVVTIAAGVVTITATRQFVDTEASAATDDLNTISGGSNYQLLILSSASSGRDTTLKDGIGNLLLAGDFTLSTISDRIVLMKEGSNWVELSRSTN